MGFKSFKTESKRDYGIETSDPDFILNHDQLKIGAILRIADAVEIVSSDYVKLKKRNELLEEQNKYLQSELSHANNRIRAYKGQITKYKNRENNN